MEILEKKVRNKMVDLSVENEKESKEETQPEEEEKEEHKKIKKKKPKKPVVIVEESSSDDDENVIYIKRKSYKPKNVPTIDPQEREPQKQFPAFGQMPRANLQNFNFNRQFM